jgi:hypothetical protein
MMGQLRRLARNLRRFSRREGPPAPLAADRWPTLLHIPTSDGSGEACHPSVVDASPGFAGYRFWMANTPYAGNDHKLENPELFASHDGLSWEVPEGVRNPLVGPPPGDRRHHHSDPCLLVREGRLWLFFRTSDEAASPRRDWISVMIGSDAGVWSVPRTVLADNSGRLLLSPCVRVVAGLFMMWTVEAQPGSRTLEVVLRKSADGFEWSAPETTEIAWPGQVLEPWHIDVTEEGSGFVMHFSARQPSRSGTQRWCRAVGDGMRWRVEMAGGNGLWFFESGKPYKPSFLPPSPDRPTGWLYTSSMGSDGLWYTALRPGAFGL